MGGNHMTQITTRQVKLKENNLKMRKNKMWVHLRTWRKWVEEELIQKHFSKKKKKAKSMSSSTWYLNDQAFFEVSSSLCFSSLPYKYVLSAFHCEEQQVTLSLDLGRVRHALWHHQITWTFIEALFFESISRNFVFFVCFLSFSEQDCPKGIH